MTSQSIREIEPGSFTSSYKGSIPLDEIEQMECFVFAKMAEQFAQAAEHFAREKGCDRCDGRTTLLAFAQQARKAMARARANQKKVLS